MYDLALPAGEERQQNVRERMLSFFHFHLMTESIGKAGSQNRDFDEPEGEIMSRASLEKQKIAKQRKLGQRPCQLA
jgi:hypothetical protein